MLTMSVIGKTLLCLALILSVVTQGRTTTLRHLLEQEEEPATSTDVNGSEDSLTTTTEQPRDPFRFLILCAPGSKKRNTCEKCTKVTRDPNTYQMCCENTRGVRTWCEKFLNPSIWMKVANSAS